MPIENIPVDQGRKTTGDPSKLAPGELLVATDATYKPNDGGVHKIGGRTEFNSISESAILGVRNLEFDDGTNLFVTATKTSYRKANAGLTGTFSDIETGISEPKHLDSTHFEDEHFLHDGVNRGRVIDRNGAATLHGMLFNAVTPTVVTTGSGFTLTNNEVIRYWIEERVKVAGIIVKRNADTGSTVLTITGTGGTVTPVVSRPPVVNSDATHWALMGSATEGNYPIGAELGEVAIGVASITDTRTGTNPGLPTGEIYQILTLRIAGATINVAKNGQPPIATQGDIFEDSLVTTGTDKSRFFFSVEESPHAFSAQNYIGFEDKTTDFTILFRRLDNVGIAVLRDAIWRINFLPRPSDSEFSRGRVKNKIEGAHGGVGPLAADTFSFGRGLRLAYVSRYGILVTDGQGWDVLTDDVDWENTVNVDKLSQSILRNNPREYRLEFYYTPKGGTENTECMYLFYHPSHAKQSVGGSPRAKALWPVNVKARAAMVANVGNVHFVFTANPNGKLYQEDSGNVDNSDGGGIKFDVLTPDKYLNGQGGHSKLEKLWAHHSAAPGQTAKVRAVQRNEGSDDNVVDWNIKLDRRENTQGQKQAKAEAFQFGIFNDDIKGSFRLDYFTVQTEMIGESEEG